MMRIDSIRLENYRCHADLTVEFGPGFNVIVGVNGSGKTSLLNGVCEALSAVLNHLNVPGMSPFQDDHAVRLLVTQTGGRFRFEPQNPVRLTLTGVLPVGDGTEIRDCWLVSRPSQGGVLVDGPQREYAKVLPVWVFYRANRQWNHGTPGELQAATQRSAQADGYSTWWDASTDGVAFLTWVVSKHLERLAAASELGEPPMSKIDDELSVVNAALVNAVEGMRGLRYDFVQKSVLVEWQRSQPPRDPTPFENLSDGQKAVIGLVADIARRMCLLNPHLGQDVTQKTDGVVLIDELDVHLHPQWQRILTNGLKKAFPSVQFIVASHSPQVLGELSPQEIILLRPEGTAHPQVSYGLDSSRVLEEIMGAAERTAEVETALAALFTALERNELDEARKTLKQLRETAPGIAELGGAEALLKRKEVLGR